MMLFVIARLHIGKVGPNRQKKFFVLDASNSLALSFENEECKSGLKNARSFERMLMPFHK